MGPTSAFSVVVPFCTTHKTIEMNASVDVAREDESCGVELTRPSSGSAGELVVSSNGTYDDGSDSAPVRLSCPWINWKVPFD